MTTKPFDKCPTCGYSMRKRGQVNEMIELANDGLTVNEIADRLGVTHQAVYRAFKVRNVKYTKEKWTLARRNGLLDPGNPGSQIYKVVQTLYNNDTRPMTRDQIRKASGLGNPPMHLVDDRGFLSHGYSFDLHKRTFHLSTPGRRDFKLLKELERTT